MGWGNENLFKWSWSHSNGRGHMTKLATMPIYGKNLKISSSPEPKADYFEAWYAAKFVQMMTLG